MSGDIEERYAHGEVEREFEGYARRFEPGSIFHRLCMWVALKRRKRREEIERKMGWKK